MIEVSPANTPARKAQAGKTQAKKAQAKAPASPKAEPITKAVSATLSSTAPICLNTSVSA